MVSVRESVPQVVFVGGAEVGLEFLKVLVDLRDCRQCRLVGALPSHKSEESNPRIEPFARRVAVPVLESLDDLLTVDGLDFVISVGNHKLFSASHIAHAKRGIVNFHAAPLPEYRGSACPAFALLNKEPEFGATFHFVVEQLDAGPILHVERFAILPDYTAGDLDQICVERGVAAFARMMPRWLEGAINTKPAGQPIRQPYRRDDIEPFRQVDPSWPPDQIWRHVRACDWDGVLQPAFAKFDDCTVYLTAKARGSWF